MYFAERKKNWEVSLKILMKIKDIDTNSIKVILLHQYGGMLLENWRDIGDVERGIEV